MLANLKIISQKWWDPRLRSVFSFCFQLFPVFVSITKFSDFWVISYGNWKHILGVFSFQNSVSNEIFIIKHTCMGPTVSAKSHRALLLTNPPTAHSQSSHQKSTHRKISHIQSQSSSHTHPQPSHTYRATPPQPTRASPSSDQQTWCPENPDLAPNRNIQNPLKLNLEI